MPWAKWNKADKTLFFALLIFLLALCVHLEHKENIFASGFLFCAEAALVGGIADWFAVTALFKKPRRLVSIVSISHSSSIKGPTVYQRPSSRLC